MSNAHRPEVLAPAGDHAALAAALGAGADAVYFGLDDGFNARARAANFAAAELPTLVATIHAANARAYITLNTLVFESELPVVTKLLERIAAAGADAVIVQDPAVALLANAIGLEVHASTQMTVSGPSAARLIAELGVSRIVAPRELSLAEIEAFAAASPVPLEVFVHGALCVSWSGQCLTSESWGGRSANRGQCAQSCRLPYDLIVDGERRDIGDVRYLLSPKDLVGLDFLRPLAELGIASLKIEGRQKAAHYVAEAVRSYRHAVDAAPTDKMGTARERLALAYSRGESNGFLAGADHQRLVEGRFPRHRGVALGFVSDVSQRSVVIERRQGLRPNTGGIALPPSQRAVTAEASDGPLSVWVEPRPGMGVAFDQGQPEADETGGPIFAVEAAGPDRWRLGFGVPGPDLTRVRVGDRVWITSDPQILRQSAHTVEQGKAALGRIAVTLAVSGRVGAPLVVTATCQPRYAATAWAETVTSRSPLMPARGEGLSQELLVEKLGGFGGTAFCLGELVAADLERGAHLPVSELKELRRGIVAALATRLAAPPTRNRPPSSQPIAPLANAATPSTPELVVLCRNDQQLDAAIQCGATEVELDWMELVGLAKALARARNAGVSVTLATPRVQKPGEEKIDAHLARLLPDGLLIRSWGSLAAALALPASNRPQLHGDFSLNITNSMTARWVHAQGLSSLTCAHDLDADQLADLLAATPDLPWAVTIHHHMPTFHTEHCVYAHLLSTGRDFHSCGRPCERHEVSLSDRVGWVHPVVVDVGCRNTVFNAQAQSAASMVPRLLSLGVRRLRIELVRESADETSRVVRAYQDLIDSKTTPAATVALLSAHEQFGVSAGTMRTLRVLP